jgi:hypothetical protein
VSPQQDRNLSRDSLEANYSYSARCSHSLADKGIGIRDRRDHAHKWIWAAPVSSFWVFERVLSFSCALYFRLKQFFEKLSDLNMSESFPVPMTEVHSFTISLSTDSTGLQCTFLYVTVVVWWFWCCLYLQLVSTLHCKGLYVSLIEAWKLLAI